MHQANARNTAQHATRVLEGVVLLGAAALIAYPAVKNIARRWRTRHPYAETESAIDKSLDDTYPASDPPASRYVDIPVNRR
ncbi:MAG TPA: hypothetical protein VK025_08310 [Steroidobacter sp.]|jgi:hypothetical protein|nr:hypothetical protein [Steroidobacteraceae bacterium]HLS81391.1 hypothetical protein [Steroidobacter sp.]